MPSQPPTPAGPPRTASRSRIVATLRRVAGAAALAVAVSASAEPLPAPAPDPAAVAVAAPAPASTSGAVDDAAPAPPPVEPAPPALFYFFSPDWRPPDLGRLGSAMEASLAGAGVRVTFQAFTRYEDFERHLTEKPPSFLIAPAWLRGAGSATSPPLAVVVVPSRRGRTTYRKALMSRPGIESVDGLARASVAATLHATDNGPASEVLAPFHLHGDSTRLVPVPKDVDALLALSFGQVDGALVTAEQYDQLALSNPAEAARLRVLAFSPEASLPPVFAMPGVDAALTARLREKLLRLADDPDGASALALLGFDAFIAEPDPAPRPAPAARPAAAAKAGARPSPPPKPASRPAGKH